MSQLQIEARALGDPTRHRIFEYLIEADRPVDVAELTTHFELNHNAIRQHLAKLVVAGLATESTAPSSGKGRPRLLYAVSPSTESRWGAVGPYERLALLLTDIVRSGDTPVEVGRRAGRRVRLGGTSFEEPLATFVTEMGRLGFGATTRATDDGLEVRLHECPFTSAALADPDTVCALHLGLALGVADAIGGIGVEDLSPKDPRHGHCRLRCSATERSVN